MVTADLDRLRLPALIAAVYAVAFTLVLLLRPIDGTRLVAFDDGGGILAAIVAGGILLKASRSAYGNIRRGWLRLGLGLLVWAIGDTIWAVEELVLHREPFPSTADAFYLAGYPLLFFGVLSFSYRDRITLSLRTALDASAVTLAGSAVVWHTAVEPIFDDSTAGLLEKALLVLYPMGDILVLSALAMAIFRHRDGKAGTVFGVFATGMVVVLASDVGFAYLENAGIYASGSLLDAGWLAGFLLMGYSGLMQLSWRPQYFFESDDLSDPAWKQGLPLVVMVVITSWVTLQGLDDEVIDLPFVGAILLMMFAVVIRHFLTLRENIQLRMDLEKSFAVEQSRARTDALTGKLNRHAILDQIDALTYEQGGLAIGMADIDGMKRINDGYGHQSGDDALVAVANALEEGALVGRYGGDEFLIILDDAAPEAIEAYRARVDATLAAWSDTRPDGLRLTVSIGVALRGSDAGDIAELIDRADQRMYAIKRRKLALRGATARAA